MSERLLPCPFCGSDAELIKPYNGEKPYVMCSENFCTAPKDNQELAAEAWNRRAPFTQEYSEFTRLMGDERKGE